MAISVALDPSNSPAQNKAEIVAALASYTRGGEIRLPRAEADFLCEPGIVWPATRNLSLVGEGGGSGYDDSNAGTKLRFTAGATGIDCSQIDMFSDPAAPYAVIGGISLNGDHVCQVPLKVGGVMEVRHAEVKYGAFANILATNLVNSLHFDDVTAYGSDGYGYFMPGYPGETNPNNTIVTFKRFKARSNLVGMRFEQADGVRGEDNVIEANYREGLQLYRAAGRYLGDFLLRSWWFEANWRGEDGYAITIDGAEASPEAIRLLDCPISVGGLAKAMLITRVNGGLLDSPRGFGQIDLGSGCHDFGLLDVPEVHVNDRNMTVGFAHTDLGTSNWRKRRSGIGEAPAVGGTGTWPKTTKHTLPDQDQTLTPAQVVNGRCEIFPTQTRVLTMPPAADIIAYMGGYSLADTTSFGVRNRTSYPNVNVTIVGNAGTSVEGENNIPNGTGLFDVRQDSATTVSFGNMSTH